MIAWPFLNDSGLYAQLGRTVASGGVLYQDFYETKLPGAALLASAFWRAFGSHWAGYVLCELCMAMIASLALARTAGRHIAASGRLPVFLYATVFLNLSHVVYTGFQLETMQAFFEALAAMSAIESLAAGDLSSTFATGLAAGTAAMAKPGGLGVAAAFLLVMILRGRRRVMHSLILLAGVSIPTAVTAIYTFKSGVWPYLPGVIHDISNYASGTPINSDAVIKLLMAGLVFGFPFFVRAFGKRSAMGGTPLVQVFILSWLAFDFAAVMLQRRLYPYHFLPLACPLAMAYGVLPAPTRYRSILIGLLPISLLSLTWEGSSISRIGRGHEHLAVSDYIAFHTTANDAVFADQIGRLLIETARQPGARLGTFFYLVNDDDAPARYMKTLLDDFESRRPLYLVLPDGWDQPVPGLANCDILLHRPERRDKFIMQWDFLRRYVARRYHREATIDNTILYRRD